METVLDRQTSQATPGAASAPAKKTWKQRILNEMRVVAIATLYFFVCFGFLMLFKRLTLAAYKIDFAGLGMAVFAALLAGKVVIVLEKVPLGGWIRRQPAVVEVVLRSVVYVFGAFVVLMLEQGFHARHEAGGWLRGTWHVLQTKDRNQLFASLIGVFVTMLVFNIFIIAHRSLGTWPLLQLYFSRHGNRESGGESSHH